MEIEIREMKESDAICSRLAEIPQGMVFHSRNAEETFALGKRLGEESCGGQVYTLSGDLGAGKTLFTQGFAAGLGITEPVSSPTFTILQVYETGRLPLFHFDAYRIADAEEMDEIGWEDCIYGGGVCIVEWAELIREILPQERICVRMDRDPEQGFDYRRITLQKKSAAERFGKGNEKEQMDGI